MGAMSSSRHFCPKFSQAVLGRCKLLRPSIGVGRPPNDFWCILTLKLCIFIHFMHSDTFLFNFGCMMALILFNDANFTSVSLTAQYVMFTQPSSHVGLGLEPDAEVQNWAHSALLSRLKFLKMFLRHLVPWPPDDIHGKFHGDRPRETPPAGGLNARGVGLVKYSDFGCTGGRFTGS